MVNLCINAAEAMKEGGRLEVKIEDIELKDEDMAGHPGLKPGPYIRIRVTDTGHGMNEKTKRRIFDPFLPPKKEALAWD